MARQTGRVSLYEILKGGSVKVSSPKSDEPPPPVEPPSVTPAEEVKTSPEISPIDQKQSPQTMAFELGERIIKLTYNSAVFFLIVTLFLLFVAFTYGLRIGKKWIEPKFTTAQTSGGYTIKIAQFPYVTEAEQRNAITQAQNIGKIINDAKHTIDKDRKWLVVHYGYYTGESSEDAQEAMKYIATTLKKYNSSFSPTFLPLGR